MIGTWDWRQPYKNGTRRPQLSQFVLLLLLVLFVYHKKQKVSNTNKHQQKVAIITKMPIGTTRTEEEKYMKNLYFYQEFHSEKTLHTSTKQI